MKPRKLIPSKGKSILLFCSCMVLAIASTLTIKRDVMDWLGVLLCVSGAVFFALQLLPGSSWLQLDNDGFTICNFYPNISLFVERHIGVWNC